MSRQIYMIFFLLQHTPARRRWNIGTVSECRDAIHCVSTGNAMWDFFRHGREFYSTTISLTFLSPLYSTL